MNRNKTNQNLILDMVTLIYFVRSFPVNKIHNEKVFGSIGP